MKGSALHGNRQAQSVSVVESNKHGERPRKATHINKVLRNVAESCISHGHRARRHAILHNRRGSSTAVLCGVTEVPPQFGDVGKALVVKSFASKRRHEIATWACRNLQQQLLPTAVK